MFMLCAAHTKTQEYSYSYRYTHTDTSCTENILHVIFLFESLIINLYTSVASVCSIEPSSATIWKKTLILNLHTSSDPAYQVRLYHYHIHIYVQSKCAPITCKRVLSTYQCSWFMHFIHIPILSRVSNTRMLSSIRIQIDSHHRSRG